MPQPEFIVADARVHRPALIELNVEYVSWVFTEIDQLFGVSMLQIVGTTARDYVPTVIDKICGDAPPKGVFYMVKVGHTLAGMGGLRSLESGVAEIKRVYVRPEFRGMQLGNAMLKRLLSDATAFGYQRARLDTAPFMQAAHRIYERHGFVDCLPYEGSEVPTEFQARWRFMERAL